MTENFDIIVIGGGVMGCAITTYLLRMDPTLQIAILEKDPTYARASTPLSDGNTRVQFNVKENIQISQYGLEVMADFAETMAVGDKRPDLHFRRQGNLFLIEESQRPEAERGLILQQSLGCRVDWLEPEEIQQIYPGIQLNSCVGATFGRDDGTLDPWALLQAYKDKAIALGAHYLKAEAVQLLKTGNRVHGVQLENGSTVTAASLVASAGAWTPDIARTLGIELPVHPVRRQVFVIETNLRPQADLPMLLLPTGLYLIHERDGVFMCGKSLPDDPVGFDFSWTSQTFIDVLWPDLIEYIPALDRLKVARGWSGLYAVNSFDGNAILGPWPDLEGLTLVTGFSGHGLQQCHAVGRYIAEMILDRSHSLDLSIFSPRRILENQPVWENEQRII